MTIPEPPSPPRPGFPLPSPPFPVFAAAGVRFTPGVNGPVPPPAAYVTEVPL
jgi:hypothetical protein